VPHGARHPPKPSEAEVSEPESSQEKNVSLTSAIHAPPHPQPLSPRGGEGRNFVTHPRFRTWLEKCGVTTAEAAFTLAGEVVSGHVDRHVVRVELHGGSGRRTVFLKREHTAGLKARLRNRLAGFGWVSRCEREAMTLAKLEAAGLPGPQWLAYGRDAAGRGFLLVDELTGAVELRAFLTEHTLAEEERRVLSDRIGRTLAEVHAAGFGTPELAAKHLLVRPGPMAVSLIDWQSCPPPGAVKPADCDRWLATLHATLADELATPMDRLRVLWAYRRTLRMTGQQPGSRFGAWVRSIAATADGLLNKSSVRAQRQPVVTDVCQRLVWLAGEQAVAIPEVAAGWPTPPTGEPFYSPTPNPPGGHRERHTMPDGRDAVLVRFTTTDPLGRFVAAVRERPWRSPAAVAARVLFHLQRHAIPAPALLAFGQRMVSRRTCDSFLVGELPPNPTAITDYLSRPEGTAEGKQGVLRECGRLLRRLHAAGCRPCPSAGANDPLFVVSDGTVFVGSPFAVTLSRRPSEPERQLDLNRFATSLPPVAHSLVLSGYSAPDVPSPVAEVA
jgi:tRNA A-37 threonylcarbamoyl transferase component Bud32